MKKQGLIVWFIILDLILMNLDTVIMYIYPTSRTLGMYIFYCLTFVRFSILYRLLNYFIKTDSDLHVKDKKRFNIYSYIAIGFFFLWIVFQFFELLRVIR